MKGWTDQLDAAGACRDAVQWATGYPDFQAAWDACPRGDWLLWWIGRSLTGGPMHPGRRPLVRVACQCARLALPYVRAGEARPLAAIELAERWASGDETVTCAELRSAAYAAAYAAAADAAAYAAYAAAAAAYAAARSQMLARCADLVRAEYQQPPTPQRQEVA